MKIYTKTGDKGDTSLYGGSRISKNSPRISAIGEIDELNATFGVLIQKIASPKLNRVKDMLFNIQNELFVIGADMATPYSTNKGLKILRIKISQVATLENLIDKFENDLDPIRNFILPGGSELGALLHHARSVCRRAERSVVYVSEAERINPNVVIYLNRLSDLLFVTARYVNKKLGEEETPWISK